MKIGIYLGYPPCGKSFSLKKEGLGRYLAFLIKGFTKNNNEIVIACPRWVVDAVNELIEEENISRELVKFLVPTDMPFIYKIYLKHIDKEVKFKNRRIWRLQKVTSCLIDRIIETLICTKNAVLFAAISIVLILLGVLTLPFTLIILLLLTIRKIIKALGRIFLKTQDEEKTTKDRMKKIIKQNRVTRLVLNKIRQSLDTTMVKEKMRKSSAKEIINKINRMTEPMDVWYCPMAFWNEFNLINGTKVICVPDLVTTELPLNFTDSDYTVATDNVKNTINNGTYFITYCEYLKTSLLINKFSKSHEDVIAIPHATNNMLEFIDVEGYFKDSAWRGDVNNYFCKNIIMPYITNNSINMVEYLTSQGIGNFSYKDIKYIFYSSQVRPNKNILTLIKAYEYILREKNIPIKLILTGNITLNKDIYDYIKDNRLQYDILSFYNVSNQQLAALYKQAELVVNPTLYEGGFPFTFGEGMSVGTPSIMSDIPQVMEVIKGYDLEDCIFDPYDYKDLASKIIYGLNHREEIYLKQKILYEKLEKRSWEDICKDYQKAFEYFITKDKKNIVNGVNTK